jgi:hypothetical protein
MLSFKHWTKRKKRKPSHERHTSETDREIGHQSDQGEAAGADSQIPSQRVLVFPIPELEDSSNPT